MLFSSIPFLYCFLPVVVILYLLVPKKGKNAVLLAASLLFYAWGEKLLVCMLMGTILLGWLFGLLIEKRKGTRAAKVLLWISALIDLGMLGYFKYADFFIESVNRVLPVSLPLPIGISFYTFQILSYTVDVYREKVPAQRNLVDFAAYVCLFPQLIAGPIVRYADIEVQLGSRVHTWEKTASGVRRFLIGLGKKVLLANVMGELCTNFRATMDVSVLYYWMYAVAFMLQIYYDFSGYSDMAIGLGRMFGFEFMENFDYPYVAGSITEFWRRWHISLGSWFRDYVYIPLGGNRKGLKRQMVNILVVWMLTGLWHGAAWNFVLWGLFYAVLLMIEKMGLLKWLGRHEVVGHIYTLFMVLLGFVLFNASDFGQAWRDMAGMVGFSEGIAGNGTVAAWGFGNIPMVSEEAVYYLKSYGVVFLMAFVGATPWPKRVWEKVSANGTNKLGYLEPVFLSGILMIVTAYLVDGSFNPFLYFRF